MFWARSQSTEFRPTFSIARSLKHQQKYDESLELLKEMSDLYPEEMDLWLEMLELAVMDLKDHKVAETIYREGLTALEKQKSRDLLTRFYNNITDK